jgi:site-specific recombinase XerD
VPHTLRHAFASHALESESDLLVLKATLGHASMKSTEIYLHPSLRMMLQAMNDHLASDILSELKIKERGVFKIQPSRKLSTA